jgi:predicted DNA-binding protein (MmcQ/YjbR family)
MALTPAKAAKQLQRIRTLAMALPEATEINFRVRKKIFCFPGDGGSVTVKADREELPALLDDPRCAPAPYLARGGWIRMDLSTGTVDWDEIDELIRTSYVLIAPKTLGRQLGT